ncbi:MAG: hypothetical protein VKL20_02565 [Synechocystis sp.]|nr:hypothetical protein [Synechocystis sp.]
MALPVNPPGWIFCQFPQLHPRTSSTPFHIRWQTDRRLQQHWQRTFPPIAPQDWDQSQEAIIAQTLFQRRSPDAKIITQHWQAWLSRQGVKAAKILGIEVAKLNRGQSDGGDVLPELVQMALEFIVDVDAFFESFQPVGQSPDDWYAVLNAWAYRKIYGRMIDRIREKIGWKTFKRSDLGLATRATRKRVIDALTDTGLARLAEQETQRYALAIRVIQQTPAADCLAALACCGNPGAVTPYQQVLAQWIPLKISVAEVSPVGSVDDQHDPSQLPAIPTNSDFVRAIIGKFLLYLDVWWHVKTLIKLKQVLTPQWPAIAAEQQRQSRLGLTLKPDQVEPIATVIGKAVRLYSDPPLTRVNLVQEDGQSLLENLPDPHPPHTEDDPDGPAPLWQTASQSMGEYLAQLDPITQQVAQKLYGENMSQTVVASNLNISQATVARYQRRILTGLIQALNAQDHLPTLSAQSVATIKPALIDWLKHHYQSSN